MSQQGLVVLMCGLPGAGKSTNAMELEKQGFIRLSIDEEVWRQIGPYADRMPFEAYEELQDEIEAQLWEELTGHLREGRQVVVDYSFWSREQRERYKSLIEQHGSIWRLLYFKASVETLLRRLQQRNTLTGPNNVKVSEELLRAYAASFEEPRGEGEILIPQD